MIDHWPAAYPALAPTAGPRSGAALPLVRIRELRRRAHELYLLASEILGEEPMAPLPVLPVIELEPAQHRIMRLLAAGRVNTEIAYELRISEKTVRNQVADCYRKLGVHDRVNAALVYRRMYEVSDVHVAG